MDEILKHLAAENHLVAPPNVYGDWEQLCVSYLENNNKTNNKFSNVGLKV